MKTNDKEYCYDYYVRKDDEIIIEIYEKRPGEMAKRVEEITLEDFLTRLEALEIKG